MGTVRLGGEGGGLQMRSSVFVYGSRLVAAHTRYSGLDEMRAPRDPGGFEPRHVRRGAAAGVRKGATVY